MLAEFACDFDDLDHLWSRQIPLVSQRFHGVVVAVSGGLDSIALFHLFLNFSKKKINFNLALCHTNFGLRGRESDEDQRFVEKVAAEAGVPCFINRISSEALDSRREKNIQIWARSQRYQHFSELASDGWIVALAHHRDDLAENVLFRLARGTSPGSIAGMSAWAEPYWRPLIGLSREHLSGWVDRHELRFRHDSSNDKIDYSRNLIRHKILPLLEQIQPGAKKRIARTALQASELGDFCTKSFQILIEKAKHQDIAVCELLDKGRYLGMHILAQIVGPLQSGRKSLEESFLKTVWVALKDSVGGQRKCVICLPASDDRIEISDGRFRLVSGLFGKGDKRALQHQPSRTMFSVSFYLSSRSKTELELPDCTLIWSNIHRTPSFCLVQVPRSQQKLRFVGQRKVWSFKNLMIENNLSVMTRDRVFLISESKDKQPSGQEDCIAILLDLDFLVPDQQGSFNRVSICGMSAVLREVQ